MRAPRDVLAMLFEGAPRFIARLAQETVDSWEELFDSAARIALEMPADEQLELLNAHPRIGAVPASVSAMSYREQGYDRDPGTAALEARLDRLNSEYEQRFGFRFVVFVNGRSRETIADYMATRLDEDREAEKRRALADVVAIARNRISTLSAEQQESR